MKFITISNLLTLARVCLVPVLSCLMAMNTAVGHWSAFAVFIVASVTDYLDGKLARSWSQVSPFGKFFDPVADKLLTAASLFMLASLGRLPDYHIIAGLIILCREIFVSGLREFLAEINCKLPVSALGKLKTTVQFIALMLLILNPEETFEEAFEDIIWLEDLGFAMLWAAATLTLISGYDYLRAGLTYIKKENNR